VEKSVVMHRINFLGENKWRKYRHHCMKLQQVLPEVILSEPFGEGCLVHKVFDKVFMLYVNFKNTSTWKHL